MDLRIRWQEILAGNLHFIEKRKTYKSRCIEINDSVWRKCLAYYDRMYPLLEQLIFLSQCTGQAYTTQNINARLRNFKKKDLLTDSLHKTFGKKIYENNGQPSWIR